MTDSAFLRDVDTGLSHTPKYVSSHYFYDETGDALFRQIMGMPEYYLTDAELEIFKTQADRITKAFALKSGTEFELIELGAGDGKKTQHLLQQLLQEEHTFRYVPVDISQHSLDLICSRFRELFPALHVRPEQGEYFKVLDRLFNSGTPKILLFIGSNLGNLEDDVAKDFLHQLSRKMKPGEKLLLGLDLVKSRDIVLPAYDDAAGITAAFNLNLLSRINESLGADFKTEQFRHTPVYDEKSGIARSYLESLKWQEVYIEKLNKSFVFEKGELLHTEISRKYDERILDQLLLGSGLQIISKFTDSRSYFADFLIEKQ